MYCRVSFRAVGRQVKGFGLGDREVLAIMSLLVAKKPYRNTR